MKVKKGDFITIFFILIIALGIFIYHQVNRSEVIGKQVIIEVDGEIIKTFDLPQNKLVQYKVVIDEDDYNLVEILGNQVRVKEATCPEQVDVKEGWISEAGDALICLPHKLIVRITGEGEKEDDVDIITF